MKRTLAALAPALAVVLFVPTMSGCGSIFGSKSTPTATFTPTLTHTPTSTPTPTATATPTATPTPALPPNPDALQRWAGVPVSYCIASDQTGYVGQDEFTALVARAFAAWGVPAVNNGDCPAIIEDDDVNQIGWGSLGTGPDARGDVFEAGLTSLRYRRCTSGCDPNDPVHIIEADITIDATPPREFRTTRCLYGTLLHETGHFLGLEHLPPPTVMAAETSTCLEALTDADVEALLARYGDAAHPSD